MRVGIGFDVHRFKEGETLILGGVYISYHYGLSGHSDADVLTHALMDAILGALGRGDIGQYFPDTDPQYRNINSLSLLKKVNEFLNEDNYIIENIDLIIIAEAPKISPHYNKIKENYGQIMGITNTKINIKATTTEKLGFIGRGEGIAAQSVVLLTRRGREKV